MGLVDGVSVGEVVGILVGLMDGALDGLLDGEFVMQFALARPNVSLNGPTHLFATSGHFCNVWLVGVDPVSLTPTSTDVLPAAGPSVAVNEPSYDKNSTSVPLG